MSTRERAAALARRLRDRSYDALTGADALTLPCVLGILTGLLTGSVMVIFRIVVEQVPSLVLDLPHTEAFHEMPAWLRLLLPTLGGLFIGLVFQMLRPAWRPVGLVHVRERLISADGRMPVVNAITQFGGASVSLMSGHCVGREGPAIHIGATGGSFLGQVLRLPHNQQPVLVACGAAAAIAASFNTPLAGVVFALEVLLKQMTLSGMAPIIMAAVSATAVSRWVFGSSSVFLVPTPATTDLPELWSALLIGVVVGMLSAALVRLLRHFSRRLHNRPLWLRMGSAGLITGLLALPLPHALGTGYGLINEALAGELLPATLALIVLAKLLATAAGLGLGLPGGIIGPTLAIGAAAGGALGALLETNPASYETLHVLLGMGTMMAATLHAPLAALAAISELTGRHEVIFPGMLAVVIGYLVSRDFLRTGSVFEVLMSARGIEDRSDPVVEKLRRLAVARGMHTGFASVDAECERETLERILEQGRQRIVILSPGKASYLITAAEAARVLEKFSDPQLKLLEQAEGRRKLGLLSVGNTLAQARRQFMQGDAEAFQVSTRGVAGEPILGTLLPEDIDEAIRS